jgi:hypothetical protein
MTDDEIAAFARKALDEYLPDAGHWCTGELATADGRACLVGALAQAGGWIPSFRVVTSPLGTVDVDALVNAGWADALRHIPVPVLEKVARTIRDDFGFTGVRPDETALALTWIWRLNDGWTGLRASYDQVRAVLEKVAAG